jgi:hypothetical protein
LARSRRASLIFRIGNLFIGPLASRQREQGIPVARLLSSADPKDPE